MMDVYIKNIIARLKAVPKWFWILLAIVVVGIFLRTYEFRDWMEFNPDQARDAILVQNLIEKDSWPIMGPQAGNKVFKLGPMFYYFELAAAKLFGITADKMAYPDLLFSIATIVLMFFFLRKFFERNLSLLLVFLFSISFFVVTYSRFAFNPNSIPFFTLLFFFALLGMLDAAPKEKLWWAVLLGIAMGVGFQLHTILFIGMPFVALLVLGYLFARKQFIWKSVLVTIVFFLLANAGQLSYEMKSNGANLQSFFSDAKKASGDAEKNYIQDFSNDIVCHIQANTYIISALGSGDKCNLTKLSSQIRKKGIRFNLEKIAITAFGTVFTAGGFILFFLYGKKENDPSRKRAFVLIAAYCVTIFLILFSVSSTVSMRYFIVVEFLPFLLAGFWMKFVLEKIHGKPSIMLVGLFAIVLAMFNISATKDAVIAFNNKTASTDNVAYFGEVEAMSQYMIEHSNGAKTIYLSGKKAYLSRYGKPLEYFGKQQGVAISKVYNMNRVKAGDPFFYVLKNISKKKTLPEVVKGFTSEAAYTFGNVTIIELTRSTNN